MRDGVGSGNGSIFGRVRGRISIFLVWKSNLYAGKRHIISCVVCLYLHCRPCKQ